MKQTKHTKVDDSGKHAAHAPCRPKHFLTSLRPKQPWQKIFMAIVKVISNQSMSIQFNALVFISYNKVICQCVLWIQDYPFAPVSQEKSGIPHFLNSGHRIQTLVQIAIQNTLDNFDVASSSSGIRNLLQQM